jgi:nucleoside 2-deoxyribosyltransferase
LENKNFFENKGFSVHNVHKREECAEIDFKEISSCDLFVAFPGYPASPGTHIEIGWASTLKKPVILLLEQGKDYAFLVRGLGKVANVIYILFDQERDYLIELEEYLNMHFNKRTVPQ